MKTEEFKAYVEDISKNNTCHRPDISMYGPCDPCAYTSTAYVFLILALILSVVDDERKNHD